ncbi:hypothetical protein [Streptomyces sp. NPDC047009]|uniref:hypothetical protein n=1 Tax=Streptomyces sp. NPDC047009 TaxID=3154496 RepID=UPI0033DBBF91
MTRPNAASGRAGRHAEAPGRLGVAAQDRLEPGPADPCAAAGVARQTPQLSARRRTFRFVASTFTPVTGAITASGRAPSAPA